MIEGPGLYEEISSGRLYVIIAVLNTDHMYMEECFVHCQVLTDRGDIQDIFVSNRWYRRVDV